MLALLLTSFAFASEAPRFTVSVDPLTAALGYPHVLLEGAVVPKLSLYIGPHMRLYDPPGAPEHEPYLGFGAEFGARFFPWGEAPSGPWVAARGVAAYAFTTEGPAARGPAGYGSALAGYTWIRGPLVLAGGLGVQYIHYTVGGYGVEGVFPAAHTAIGVAF